MIGRPDFQGAGDAGDPPLLPAYFSPGTYLAVPDGLRLATDGGVPRLTLELLRGVDAMEGADAFGVLDLELELAVRTEEALARARELHPAAVVRPVGFEGGWLWLLGAQGDPADQAWPLSLSSAGVGARRWTLNLDAERATMIKALLVENTFPLSAVAHLGLVGIAPRLPLKVRFRPRAARDELSALADADGPGHSGTIPRDTLSEVLRAAPEALAMTLLGDVEAIDRGQLVAALVDLVSVDLADPVAGTPTGGPALVPRGVEALPSDEIERDLRTPFLARRAMALRLQPMDELREYLTDHGPDALIRETPLPTFASGVHMITLDANLPSARVGALALGATLTAPPRPPHRPHAVVRSVEFEPPEDRASVQLELAPSERLAYLWRASAVLEISGSMRPLDGPERDAAHTFLGLDVGDFPVRFVEVSAAPGLLALARVDGILRCTLEGAPFSVSFALDQGRPALALVLPVAAEEPLLDLHARPLASDTPVLSLPSLPADDVRLDLHSLPGYGPHRLSVRSTFTNGQGPIGVELLAEGQPEDSEAPGSLLLTPERPEAQWSWFAASPFASGYRFRTRPGGQGPPSAWSEVRPANEPLVVVEDGVS